MGAWVTYGLGTENENLPGFVVLISSGVQPNGGKNSFGSGFLPSVFQGVQCRSKGDPVLYASDPAGMDRDVRRARLDALRDLNRNAGRRAGQSRNAARASPSTSWPSACRTSVPEVMDISSEPQANARRLRRQARRQQLRQQLPAGPPAGRARRALSCSSSTGAGTSTAPAPTQASRDGLTNKWREMDKPIAALIRDLKQRGLLDDTLVICGGEFGRTPFREGRTAGSQCWAATIIPTASRCGWPAAA